MYQRTVKKVKLHPLFKSDFQWTKKTICILVCDTLKESGALISSSAWITKQLFSIPLCDGMPLSLSFMKFSNLNACSFFVIQMHT
jgi:hypothetical protein